MQFFKNLAKAVQKSEKEKKQKIMKVKANINGSYKLKGKKLNLVFQKLIF